MKRIHSFSEWKSKDPEKLSFLETDKIKNLEELIGSGLFSIPTLIVEGKNLPSKIERIKKFCKDNKNINVRALPKISSLERKTKVGLKNFNEVRTFIFQFKKVLENYKFILAGHDDREYVGNIIVRKNGEIIIEIMKSKSHPDVAYGREDSIKKWDSLNNTISNEKTLFISTVDKLGKITHHPKIKNKMKIIIKEKSAVSSPPLLSMWLSILLIIFFRERNKTHHV